MRPGQDGIGNVELKLYSVSFSLKERLALNCTLPPEQSGKFVYFGCEGPKGISGAAFLPREQKQTWVLNLITRHVRDRAKQEENQEDNTHSVRQRAVIQPSRVGSLPFRSCPSVYPMYFLSWNLQAPMQSVN